MQSYCIIHPQSQLDSKFQYDSTQVKIEVPSSDSSGDPYDDSGMSAGTGEEDVIAFDYVFPPKTSQEKIFQDIARGHVRNALHSFQSAIFIASGATGSGKTFAVTGGAQRFSDRGLIPRSVSALFEAMAAEPEREDVEVSVSFYELYKDAVVDLLSERRRKVPIKATENGPQLIGLLRQVVATESDAYHLLFQGDSNRHFQSFAQNSETSRGHVFYLLHITQRFTGKRAVLAFVDLAAPIAVRNPANAAIAQSLDALKATLLALRDGREAFWESAILPQLLEPWLGPKSLASVVLLSPVRYSSDMHQEAHEWLTFTRLAQEAYSGNPLPYSQLQKNWSGKVQNALGLPASFQEPGVVEPKEEAKKEEPPAVAPAVAFEQQSRVSQVSQVSQVSLDYPMLPSQTSLCHSQLPSQSVLSQASVPSQPSSERREERQSSAVTSMVTETEAQKASAASQGSERDSKPGEPEGPKIRAEVSQAQLAQLAQTPPGSGRKLVKALSPMASQAQYTSGMVTPPPPACMKPVSPLQGARSPIAAAIEVLRDGERVTQVHSLPAGSPERPMLNGVPPVQAMPPPRHLSPLRQIITKQVSVVPPSTGPGSAAEPANLGAGHMAPAPAPAAPAAPAPAVAALPATSMQRPSTLAVQHQQKEMQYLNNLKRHVPQQLQGTQGSAPAFVRSPSPPGGRAMRSQQLGTPIQAPRMEGAQPGHASPMVPQAGMTSFMPQAGAMTPMSPMTPAPGAATPMAGALTPMAGGAATPMAGAPRTTYSAYPVRSDSPMAYQTRSLSPMARPVVTAVAAPITAATPMRYGAFVQAQPMPVASYGAVMMQKREVVRPFAPQVPVAFKVAPPMAAQAASVTPRKAAAPAETGAHRPSRSVSPLPAGTMERVRVGRQESK